MNSSEFALIWYFQIVTYKTQNNRFYIIKNPLIQLTERLNRVFLSTFTLKL